jgi:hypothetical protein
MLRTWREYIQSHDRISAIALGYTVPKPMTQRTNFVASEADHGVAELFGNAQMTS